MDIKQKFRHILDFPEDGVDFIDITPVLADKDAYKAMMDQIIEMANKFDYDLVVAPESRGFILGTPIAYATNKGFVPIRKKGKLPYKTVALEYQLEYGSNILEIHEDAVEPGQRVLIVDDLLATGGTTYTNVKLVEKLGGIVVGIVCMAELTYLKGRDKLKGYTVDSLIQFDS